MVTVIGTEIEPVQLPWRNLAIAREQAPSREGHSTGFQDVRQTN